MNAYDINIWTSVTHNGKFSHKVQRKVLVHARNEAEAKSKIMLAPEKHYDTDNLHIVASAEYIYSCVKFGTVKKELHYTYSDGRHAIPCEYFKNGVMIK